MRLFCYQFRHGSSLGQAVTAVEHWDGRVNDDLVGSIPARSTAEKSVDQTAESRRAVVSQWQHCQRLLRLAGVNCRLVVPLLLVIVMALVLQLLLVALVLQLLIVMVGHWVVAVVSHDGAFVFFSRSSRIITKVFYHLEGWRHGQALGKKNSTFVWNKSHSRSENLVTLRKKERKGREIKMLWN